MNAISLADTDPVRHAAERLTPQAVAGSRHVDAVSPDERHYHELVNTITRRRLLHASAVAGRQREGPIMLFMYRWFRLGMG
jgi:hypothetical protein